MELLCTEYNGTFCIIFINFTKSTTQLLGKQLWTHIPEIIYQGFGSCRDGPNSGSPEQAQIFDLVLSKS